MKKILFLSLLVVVIGFVSVSMVFSSEDDINGEASANELGTLTLHIIEGLKEHEGIGDVEISYLETITVNTTLDDHELEEVKITVENLLDSKELKALTDTSSYEVKVIN